MQKCPESLLREERLKVLQTLLLGLLMMTSPCPGAPPESKSTIWAKTVWIFANRRDVGTMNEVKRLFSNEGQGEA